FFFFQAEDGIRYATVTGVQTCALPISNNGWLQELPKPLTKMTWDNPVLIGPSMADRLHLKSEDVVRLDLDGRKIEAPVWIQAGHPDNSVTVFLGYGRRRAGRAGTGAGF